MEPILRTSKTAILTFKFHCSGFSTRETWHKMRGGLKWHRRSIDMPVFQFSEFISEQFGSSAVGIYGAYYTDHLMRVGLGQGFSLQVLLVWVASSFGTPLLCVNSIPQEEALMKYPRTVFDAFQDGPVCKETKVSTYGIRQLFCLL